jgi:hypothetical protein
MARAAAGKGRTGARNPSPLIAETLRRLRALQAHRQRRPRRAGHARRDLDEKRCAIARSFTTRRGQELRWRSANSGSPRRGGRAVRRTAGPHGPEVAFPDREPVRVLLRAGRLVLQVDRERAVGCEYRHRPSGTSPPVRHVMASRLRAQPERERSLLRAAKRVCRELWQCSPRCVRRTPSNGTYDE